MPIAKLDFKSRRNLYNYKRNEILRNIIKSYGSLPQIAIGFPVSLRTKSGTKYGDGTNVVDVAIWNQFGTPTIPSRPFLTSSRGSMISSTIHIRRKMIQELNSGRADVDAAANQIGALCSSIVKRSITEWQDPPNAASTIEKKGDNNPLVDTGLMRQSVTWELRKKK